MQEDKFYQTMIRLQMEDFKKDASKIKIDDALQFFEFKYRDEETRGGELLIKPEYKKRLILEEKDGK